MKNSIYNLVKINNQQRQKYDISIFKNYFQKFQRPVGVKGYKKSLILCEIVPCYTVSHCFLNTAHITAKFLKSEIGAFSFNFSAKNLVWKFWKIFYAECGAPLILNNQKKIWNRAFGRIMASAILKHIRTPQDVLNIRLGPIKIGPLIYQTYLGVERATLNTKDPYLFEVVLMACHIYLNSISCLNRFHIKQVIISHNQYINYGILTRLAISRGIPVITPYAHGWREDVPFTLRYTDAKCLMPFPPYYKFKTIFSKYSKKQKTLARKIGHNILQQRLKGKLDKFVIKTTSGYSGKISRVLLPTKKKKILVLLNCFFDGPNIFRFNLFPDFYLWIDYTLERAVQTDFEWYVKAHPAGLPQNSEVVEKLKRKFPKAIFLEKNISNAAILNDGINAVFTIHGTCIHEFAYLGLPVVASGDNFHASYNFYFLPKTLKKYDSLISNAGNLKIKINKNYIKEFVFMNYVRYLNSSKKCRLFPKGYEKFITKELGFCQVRSYMQNSRALEYLVTKKVDFTNAEEYITKFISKKNQNKFPFKIK